VPLPEVRVLCWNIFHGRDAPPDPALFTRRSRILKVTEHNASHVQVNRPLLEEFARLIASASWSLCLLQEVPPWWADPLARECEAAEHRVLTSRNQLGRLRRRLADWNVDLIGSAGGGANLTLARRRWRISERRSLLLNPLPRRGLRERRRMGYLVADSDAAEICVANLHATAGDRHQAEADVSRAAATAVAWAAGRPLLFGGDFNLRPSSSPLFGELERHYGLASPTGGPRSDAIDHLLVRGTDVIEAPAQWPDERRELELPFDGGFRRLRLSDHRPVEAVYRLSSAGVR
jgi:endonuclease/exonuclease/phosphatase family metal-dependent hydrolase